MSTVDDQLQAEEPIRGEEEGKTRRPRRGPIRWCFETAMSFYFAVRGDSTPGWAKASVVGAVAYVISWIDFIPDFIPVAGQMDDLGVIAMAAFTVWRYVSDDDRRKARETVDRWLGR